MSKQNTLAPNADNNNTQFQTLDLREMINTTPTTTLIQSQPVADKFRQLYAITHPGISPAQAAAFYEAEKFHFLKLINDSANLSACDKLSLYGVFMDVAVNGLSFDPTFKHLYLVPFSVNVGTKDAQKWVKRAQLQISGVGELLLRMKQGQIKYADNPVLVYEGDEFQYGIAGITGYVNHMATLPSKSETIIACYLKITRTDGTIDVKVITQHDMNRFRKFSKDPDSKAWTDGVGGMWIAKCIKHAFKTYPKVRTGKFSAMITETMDDESQIAAGTQAMQIVPQNMDYYGGGPNNDGSQAGTFVQSDDIAELQKKTAETVVVKNTGNKDLEF